MKRHILKKSFLRGVLLLFLCIVGMGNVWGEKYKLITSTNELVIGCRYIIASMTNGSGAVMKNYVSSENNWKQIETDAINSYITYKSGMAKLTLGSSSGKWTLHNGTYYLDATSTTSSNHLKGSTDIDKYNRFSISFSNNAAIITCNAKSSNNILRYYSPSGLFSCYTSGQKPVYLYKEVEVSSINISGTPTNTEYYIGDTPSAEGLVVTATYSDNSTEDVTASTTWTFEPATIGKDTESVKIKATYQDKFDDYSYNITRISIANTEANPYSVAEAYNYINEGKGLAEEVYVKGIISKVDSYDATSGSITYWISEDGTTTSQQFMCEGGLDIEKNKFTSINDLKLGSIVVVKGLLQKNNDIYLFGMDNELVSNDDSNALTLTAIEISGVPSKTSYNVGESPSADGFVVTAIYSNYNSQESRIIDSSDVEWSFTPQTIEEGTTTVTATATYREQKNNIEFDIDINKCILTYKLVPIKNGNNEYATGSNITISGVTWNATGNTDYIPWRIGGKSIDEIERDIKSTTPVYGCVENVVISIGAKSGSIDFHSLTLSVADNPNYSNEIIYRKNSPQENTDYSFDITPATDAYYKITYKVSVSGNSNAFFYFKGATFHGRPASAVTPITSAGYATLCLPYNATVPDGLTAYTAIDNGTSITLTAKEGNTIAAGEGVVLKGKEGTYTFIATAENAAATDGNQMVGVTKDTKLTGADNAYMLTRKKEDGSIAFRLLKTDYTLGANKAYLKASNTANIRELIPALWNDNATDIDNIAKDEATATGAIYNLAGQKLMRAQKGINIINGKLVIK